MMRPYITPFAIVSLALLAPSVSAQATDAAVTSLIGHVAAAYRELKTFSITMDLTRIMETTERKVTTKLVFQKPGKLMADISSVKYQAHVVADGTTVYSDSTDLKTQYYHEPVTKFDDAVTILMRSGGGGVGLLPILLTSPDAEKQVLPGKPKSVKIKHDETIGSEPCDVMEAVVEAGEERSRIQYAFGKQDHLLRRVSIGSDTEGAKPTIVETYSEVNLAPILSDATFKYTPQAGSVAFEPPKEPQRFDARLKVGAIPPAISGVDLDGKPVTLAQFKGKVLLIDFWATWCGPCVAELPNVIAAYQKYHSKGFEILGISLDQTNSKEKVRTFVHDKNMPWRQIYDGKYKNAENAKAFGIRTIPFTLLIGTDGKIAAVAARGEFLAPAIEVALKK